MLATWLGQLAFAPLLPTWLLAASGAVTLLALAPVLFRRAPGTLWRLVASTTLLLFLAGPVRVIRTGQALPDIGLLVVDRSASMQVDGRATLADAAAAHLTATADPTLQWRRLDVPPAGTGGTALFAAIDAALAAIPPDQQAGVVAITDGVIADVPTRLHLPLHALIPAAGEQTDRRLRILHAPGFGIVGQTVQVGFAVDDLGPTPSGARIHLRWSQDGVPAGEMDVQAGEPASIDLHIARAGPTTLALQADALPNEASLLNNRAALTINGVRDRLRVLLISGEPHAGERTWRRLLKADPAVDLVHFTILRPPGRDDMTPLDQLALIAFPTRALFVDKIRGFDLIILDRFADPGILPPSYLQNIADYVRGGGALLVSAGPEFGSAASIARGPIGDILPALPPDGQDGVVTGPYRPAVTPLGQRHPVTQHLPGDAPGSDAHWGPWYRRMAVLPLTGPVHADVVLSAGRDGPPLLMLAHVNQGRVALLLSDQIWLWSRGHQGGGPQAELLRRVAHWLMAEPDLDENALTAQIATGTLSVTRHALQPADPATRLLVTDPDGATASYALPDEAGDEHLTLPATTPGLWRVQYGSQQTTAAASPANAAEYADLRATATYLRPVARSVHWLQSALPDAGALALRRNHAMRLTGIQSRPVLPPAVFLLVSLTALLAAWRREGR